MRSSEIRSQFIEYFKALGHKHVPSAPLVPADDPTLLFTNAGMNQFKDVFLGIGKRDYSRAVNSQKCMRVSGKHNDLEDVGGDTYHHTFFEMLGNWSFGDYYKREAIEWAWRLFTKEWKISPERLWATVFKDDSESERIWREVIGLSPDRVLRFDEGENFWEMAEVGPCGPCSEIHIDMGEKHCRRRGQKGHKCAVNGGCGRYIEIWNLVFIQYNKENGGKLLELPEKHVDTGMGFERLVAVLQAADSNYATDLFTPLIADIEDRTGRKYAEDRPDATAFRVIADHIRALTFAIADGAIPSNDGRGYVLRMLLRRAVRHGRKLGLEEPFLYAMVPALGSTMGDVYPEIRQHREHISRVILSEEERFHNTLTYGLEMLSEIVGKARKRGEKIIRGEDVFRLYDTYGFPVDLTSLIAGEEGLTIDEKEFSRLMDDQRERARAGLKTAPGKETAPVYGGIASRIGVSEFLGCETMSADSGIVAIVRNGSEADGIAEGDEGEIVLARTPFYAEAGGQVGDEGMIYNDSFTALVSTAQSPVQGLITHRVKVIKGRARTGDRVTAEVDAAKRMETARNHTATHLLQNALRQVLGEHVKQAGSLVAPGRMRFDFTHFTAMTRRELDRVEEIVNERIRENAPVRFYEIPYEEARRSDIIALFGEKYGERVRVIDVGGYSRELCGGTHVCSVGEIGLFAIISESSVAAGVRRIEAVSGEAAFRLMKKRDRQVTEISRLLKTEEDSVVEKIENIAEELKTLKKRARSEREGEIAGDISQLVKGAREINGVKVVTADLKDVPGGDLRGVGDRIRSNLKSGVILLGSRYEGKAHLLCMVTDDLVKKGIDARAVISEAAGVIGGKGGGRPQMAQAGGAGVEKLTEALKVAPEIIEALANRKGK